MRSIFIAIIICANLIYGTDGEHWLKLKNIPPEYSWEIYVTSFENEYYYDCNGDIVPQSTILDFYFSEFGKEYPGNIIVSDFICDQQANEGTLDDYDNKFITYRGRHKVTINIFNSSHNIIKSVYCIWNFQDCSQTEDVYFYYDYLDNKIIQSANYYSTNYGDFSNAEFKIWEDLRDCNGSA